MDYVGAKIEYNFTIGESSGNGERSGWTFRSAGTRTISEKGRISRKITPDETAAETRTNILLSGILSEISKIPPSTKRRGAGKGRKEIE